ncbi:MAG: VWA domain-containing protein [Vicingaceae bacterium]|nr:VWA domain-containing protein [Vicingaceae bacterium]
MEIDQILFKRFYKFYKKFTDKVDEDEQVRTVILEPLKPRLTLLARALSGLQNDIITSEREGGWSGLNFYLPEKVSFNLTTEDNINFYLFRTLYLSVQQQLKLNWKDDDEFTALEAKEKALENAAHILAALFNEYPATKAIYESQKSNLENYYASKELAPDYSWLYGKWMRINQKAFNAKTEALNDLKSLLEENEITTELAANPSDEVETVAVDQKQAEDSVAHNQFEKVDTLSEFNGTFKEMDGEDTLSDDEEALRELNLKHTVRTDEANHSVYQAEFVNSTNSILAETDNAENHFLHYDEWDYKNRVYKTDFCRVFPKKAAISNTDFAQQIISENKKTKQDLLKIFANIHQEYEKVTRVNFGEEINIDATTDALTEIFSNKTPSEKIYNTSRKRKKDLSVLLLMDTSLSADGYANNHKVLDVEKTAVLLFGEALNEFNINFQIDTFSSRTRNNCAYKSIKTFDENWLKVRSKIGAIEAEDFTRIGTALRHAGSLIDKEPTQKKWIILLSDGKPNDYDTYEGQYGIQDVKKALQELKNKHIKTFSLAIEAQAKYYLPQMFGHKNYAILPNPTELPYAFAKFYKQLMLT